MIGELKKRIGKIFGRVQRREVSWTEEFTMRFGARVVMVNKKIEEEPCLGCIYHDKDPGIQPGEMDWCKRYNVGVDMQWCGVLGGITSEEERIENRNW